MVYSTLPNNYINGSNIKAIMSLNLPSEETQASVVMLKDEVSEEGVLPAFLYEYILSIIMVQVRDQSPAS